MKDEKKDEKYEFITNEPVLVKLNYDQPKTGEGKWGTWWMYSGAIEGADKIFFATENLHKQIQERRYKKGDTFWIEKKEEKITIEENGKSKNDVMKRFVVSALSNEESFKESLPVIAKAMDENAVWEAKDRLHAAQTAINVAATINEGKETNPDEIKKQADLYYQWLLGKKNDTL